jgi:hypothetical protein
MLNRKYEQALARNVVIFVIPFMLVLLAIEIVANADIVGIVAGIVCILAVLPNVKRVLTKGVLQEFSTCSIFQMGRY